MAEFFAAHAIALSVAHSGPDGLNRALRGGVDLVILDVMLPGFDGFQVLRRLRSASAVPVLMLTARSESRSRIQGLDQGADDYLPKPFEPLELLARVRAILRRARPAAPLAAIEFSGVRLDPGTRGVSLNGQPLELTSIEYDILETLMQAAGRIVPRDELMQRLYNRPATVFDRAIDVHVSHLRKKFEPCELIKTVRGVGYQFVAPQEGTPRP